MAKSRIAWTEKVWNPVTGCTKVSAGCKNCYAERIAHRYWGERKFTDVQIHPDRLDAPLHWRKPCRVFVNSMSDLFHEDVPEQFIAAVFTTMANAGTHTFQVLTKRPERMREILNRWKGEGLTLRSGYGVELPNVWLGVSVENQESFMARVYDLLAAPAAIHWLSVEPLLGPVNFGLELKTLSCAGQVSRGVDWVVVGGESGHGFREMDMFAFDAIVDRCRTAGMPLFVKQDSGLRPGQQGRIPNDSWIKEYPKP